MRGTRILQTAIIATVVVAGSLAGVGPAAANPAGVASAGSANVQRSGSPVVVAQVAECSLAGARHVSSNGGGRLGVVTFGHATSSCTETAQGTSTSTSTGTNFTLSALQSYGGPTIKVSSYQVSCSATQNGTNASWKFAGLSGLNLPKSMPSNYHAVVRSIHGGLLAEITFNEIVLPNPNDGSITMNMMHIKLFPGGTPNHMAPMSGDIYVGQTSCSPTS